MYSLLKKNGNQVELEKQLKPILRERRFSLKNPSPGRKEP